MDGEESAEHIAVGGKRNDCDVVVVLNFGEQPVICERTELAVVNNLCLRFPGSLFECPDTPWHDHNIAA